MNRARPVFLAQSSAAMASSISARRVLNALLEQRDPPEIDVIEPRLLHSLVEGLHQLLATARSGKRLSCSYQEKPKWIWSRRPFRTFA